MSQLLVNAPSGQQEIIIVAEGGGYFDPTRVLWDERADGPLPAVTLGGMVRIDGALVFDQALFDQSTAPAPAAPTVPVSVPMLNARLALIAAGLSSAVDAHIAAMPGVAGEEARAYWNFALNVRRDHPLVIALGAVLDKTPAELDRLFVDAAALDAEAAAMRAALA